MKIEHAKCLVLAKVLVADGMVTENERAFLEATMRRAKLSEEEMRSVRELEDLDDAEAAIAGLPIEERRAVFASAMDAASIDGKLSPLEAATVKRIGIALGL